jgi:hypothetical protein
MESQKKYDRVKNQARKPRSEKFKEFIMKASWYMPNGVVDIPLRHNGKTSFTQAKLCFIPCFCLIALLGYTLLQFSAIGKIKNIQTSQQPYHSNEDLLKNKSFNSMTPGWNVDGEEFMMSSRNDTTAPYFRVKAKNEEESSGNKSVYHNLCELDQSELD